MAALSTVHSSPPKISTRILLVSSYLECTTAGGRRSSNCLCVLVQFLLPIHCSPVAMIAHTSIPARRRCGTRRDVTLAPPNAPASAIWPLANVSDRSVFALFVFFSISSKGDDFSTHIRLRYKYSHSYMYEPMIFEMAAVRFAELTQIERFLIKSRYHIFFILRRTTS